MCGLRLRIAFAFLMLATGLMGTVEVGAQAIAPVGVSSRRVIAGSNVIPIAVPTDADSSRGNSLSERMLLGLGGSVVGAFVGGSIGVALPINLCRCDDPVGQALIGAAVGSIVVAVVAANAVVLAVVVGAGVGDGTRAMVVLDVGPFTLAVDPLLT